MPKLMKKAIHLRRIDGRTDPNYRKASLLKTVTISLFIWKSGLGKKIPLHNCFCNNEPLFLRLKAREGHFHGSRDGIVVYKS